MELSGVAKYGPFDEDGSMALAILLSAFLAANNFVVAHAEPSQFKQIVALVNEAYHPDHPLVSGAEDHITFAKLKSIYFHPHSKLFVLVDQTNQAVAGVLAVDHSPKLENVAFLSLFAIDKGYRGKNLGVLLVQRAEQFVHYLGKTALAVSVLKQHHELVAYFEKQGFKKNGSTFHYDLQKSI